MSILCSRQGPVASKSVAAAARNLRPQQQRATGRPLDVDRYRMERVLPLVERYIAEGRSILRVGCWKATSPMRTRPVIAIITLNDAR
jgi:hypothetical protein